MNPAHLTTAIRRLLLLLALIFVALLAPQPLLAETTNEPATPRAFNGSFTEWSLRGGAAWIAGADGPGWTVDGGFRNSFPFYLGDHRFSYRYTQTSTAGDPLRIHGLHGTFAVHPFYLALLSSGWTSHLLASLHVEVGAGAQFGQRSNEAGDDSGFGVLASVGGGFDLPLTNANGGQALWLNAVYRRSWTTLKLGPDTGQPRHHDHGLFLGLGWRINGMIW